MALAQFQPAYQDSFPQFIGWFWDEESPVIIDGLPASLTLTGITGEILTDSIISGVPSEMLLTPVTGQVLAESIIEGVPATLHWSGVTGQVWSDAVIDGIPAEMVLAPMDGEIVMGESPVTIDGIPGVLYLSGVTGQVIGYSPEDDRWLWGQSIQITDYRQPIVMRT